MRIWITGAGGFLGGALTRRLLEEKEAEIFALTSRQEELAARLSGTGAAEFGADSGADFEADSGTELGGCPAQIKSGGRLHILHRDALFEEKTESRPGDILIGCAYPRNVRGAEAASGLRYIRDVMEAAAERRFGGLINISSQSVYSAARQRAAEETDPPCLDTIYAAGKYAAELLTESCAGAIPFTNIRLASLIGPGFDQRVPNRLAEAALRTREMTVADSPRLFGFLDVEDAAEGIAHLLRLSPSSWRPVYNLGREQGFTLAEIAETVRRVLMEDLGVDAAVHIRREETEGPAENTTLNARLFLEDTGFAPSITLTESIRRIAAAKAKT